MCAQTDKSLQPWKGSARKLRVWVRRSFAREFWDWARCKQVTVPSVNDLAESIAALDTGIGCRHHRTGQTSESNNAPVCKRVAVRYRAGSPRQMSLGENLEIQRINPSSHQRLWELRLIHRSSRPTSSAKAMENVKRWPGAPSLAVAPEGIKI